jgi:vancomycin permeability regulator SanA
MVPCWWRVVPMPWWRAMPYRSRMRPHRALVVVLPVALVAAVLGWAEWVEWRASHRRLGRPRSHPGREAVVVLGFRNRGERANQVNRHRVRVALRSIDVEATETVLVLSGGAVGSAVPEAELMARYARERGYAGPMVLETASRTTWENVSNVVGLLDGFDTITIASNAVHAEKARAHLWAQRPDLAARMVRADDHRFGEIPWVKPLAAFRGLRAIRASRR